MKTTLFFCSLIVMGGITLSIFICDRERHKAIEERNRIQDSVLVDSLLNIEREIYYRPGQSSPKL